MKSKLTPRTLAIVAGALFALSFPLTVAFAQGTAFTYQGRLNDGVAGANGTYDVRFAIYDALTLGTQQGAMRTNSATTVSNGLLVVTLDFGNQFPGANRWLEIGVRTNGASGFVTLTPRQPLTPTPYAVQAANAATATTASSASSVSAGNIIGTLSLSQLPGALVTNNQAGVNITGSFSGNASGLSNLPATSVLPVTNYSIIAWGPNNYGQTNVPTDLNNVAAVAGGDSHILALRSDGSVIAWGNNDFNQLNVPAGLSNVTAVAAGYVHNLALKRDGTLAIWGGFDGSIFGVASGLSNVMAVAAGNGLSLVLRTNGTVFAWGPNQFGQTNVPAGLTGVTAVAAGAFHCLALKADGTVVAWGWNDYGQTNVPVGLSNVTAVAAGVYHSLALKTDGTVVAWGYNGSFQTNVPAGLTNVMALSAGIAFSVALKTDGTVVVWGSMGVGQASFAAGLNRIVGLGIGGSAQNFLAIRRQFVCPYAWLAGDNTFTGNQSVTGTVTAVSAVTEGFEVGGAAAGYALQDRTTGSAGRWSMFANNGTLAFFGAGANRLTISAAGAVTALSFNPTSDRNAKENFAPVQPRDVLEKVVALPLSSWNYKADTATRHVGPMAQDFYAAFNIGPDDKHIATVDADGIALAAIQGLNQKLEQTRAENAELKQQLTVLKQLVQTLATKH